MIIIYISKITLNNFKCFEGKEILEFNSGINFFVGNNNSGKTTIFKAIEFVQSGKKKDEWITKGKEGSDVSVEVEFSGSDIANIIQTNNLTKYADYVTKDSKLIIKRSSESGKWVDSKGKERKLELKNIRVFNPETEVFENPTGIDSTITALFDAQFVYSDLKNEDYRDFGKTKIVGKLINEVTKDFQKEDAWQDLEFAHKKAFGENGLIPILKNMQERIEKILNEQYGETKVEFDFGLPEMENFFKTGDILLEENGIKTNASEKGTGMQRALALSLIQVYSQIDKHEDGGASKPILFFIDEPETFLHPQAQDKLLNSLEKISESSQVFITTHSPYLLKNFNKENHSLKIFSREERECRALESVDLNLFPYSPSWGEINYVAFNVVSKDFHNELFGYLHDKAASKNVTYNNRNKTVGKSINSFDTWLNEQVNTVRTDAKHQNQHNDYKDKSMTAYIRNYIDHPGAALDENGVNIRKAPTIEEIRDSIGFMINVNKNL